MTRESLTLWLLLVATFAIRAFHLDQPIVENYVGRQIPTAMVARNLERGSGFFRPQLDTGPFPNLFLVEPPIYAQVVVAVRPILGFVLEPTGRLVSAVATAFAAWGLFGLVRRREGSRIAFLALASFGMFPVMIRYGRAFQPDALMVGCVLAGLRGWDEYEESGNWRWAVFGGFVLATGLALKITVVWSLIPFLLIVNRWSIGRRLSVAATMLVPALAWYLYAWLKVTQPASGSLASFGTASLWARSLSWEVWLRFATYENLGRGLLIRSFTPIGFVLGIGGLLACGKLDRLWIGWAIGCGLTILGLAAKWHHAYYWMVVAPLMAVGVARGLDRVWKMGKIGRPVAGLLGSFLVALCLFQSASTWKTPHEWGSLLAASREVATRTQMEQMVVAPEAVLHYAGARGYRLEFDPVAMRRAAWEWLGGTDLKVTDRPLALVDFYCELNVVQPEGGLPDPGLRRTRYLPHSEPLLVADVGLTTEEPRRRAWREAIRKHPWTKILIDEPGMMIAEIR